MKKKTSSDQMSLAGSEEEILARLHERVEKAIATIQDLRRERDALKAKLQAGESERLSALEEDCARYQRERDEIRSRIESILSNLESLDVADSSS
jgi:FtsZ-binding cell division protein ZapB